MPNNIIELIKQDMELFEMLPESQIVYFRDNHGDELSEPGEEIDTFVEAMGIDPKAWRLSFLGGRVISHYYEIPLRLIDVRASATDDASIGTYLINKTWQGLPLESGEDGSASTEVSLVLGKDHIINFRTEGTYERWCSGEEPDENGEYPSMEDATAIDCYYTIVKVGH